MAAFLQTILLLLGVIVSATSSTTIQAQGALLCSVRNRDPCANFPDLCSAEGAKCRVKGPCEYECVCLTESKECKGTQLLAPASSDKKPVESESLLIFSPELFQDFNPGPKVPVTSTSAPTTETTTTTSTTTTSTTTLPATSSSTSTSTLIALAAMIERQTALAKALQDVMRADAQQLENKTTKGVLQNDSDIATNGSSSPTATQKESDADDPSSSPKQEIKQIFENIKSSFQLLASHILGAENRSTSTTPAPAAVLTVRESSEAPLASALLSSPTPTIVSSPTPTIVSSPTSTMVSSSTAIIVPTSSGSQTEFNTA